MPSLNPQLHGRDYWTSLEHLANTPEYQERFRSEFQGYEPGQFREEMNVSRRTILKLMGAAMALAGLSMTGCRRWPEEEIRPFAHRPEGYKPGLASHYATCLEIAGVATGLLVKSYDGRPIKIEGNPLHPGSQGATDAMAQAAVLDVYDPQRSRTPVERTATSQTRHRTWDEFLAFAKPHFAQLKANQGKGLAILTESASGPTFHRLRSEFLHQFPQAAWHTWEPLHRDAEVAGSVLAFGRPLRAQYHLEKAAVVVSFDCDFLGRHPDKLRLARAWATTRRSMDQGVMSRLYAIEGNLSLTGASSDHRLPLAPAQIALLLQQLASDLGLTAKPNAAPLAGPQTAIYQNLVKDLQRHAGTSLVLVGPSLPAEHHALAHAINHKLGNLGQTVTFTAEPDAASHTQSIADLAQKLHAHQVNTLLVLGGNPAFDAPPNLQFANALRDAPYSIHLSPDWNETSALATWHLNRAHALETWSDARGWDGTLSVQQPLILPLFNGKSPLELLALLLNLPQTEGLALVRQTFQSLQGLTGPVFEPAWRRILHDGIVAASAWPPVQPSSAPALPALAAPAASSFLEITFVSDLSILDGRFANNGWLQEMPDPLSKLTWDNAAYLAKSTADQLGLAHGQMIRLELTQFAGPVPPLEIPIFIQPGIAPNLIVLPLGYGRTVCGHIGKEIGFATYHLRQDGAYHLPASAFKLTKLDRTHKLVSTQDHHLIDAVGLMGYKERVGEKGDSGLLIHDAPFAQYRKDPQLFQRNEHGNVSLALYDPPHQFNEPHAWGMAVDLSTCIGCNACVIACQAENNVPIVGKPEIERNREMHWLRIDRYFKGDFADPDLVFTPMACVHCENAPCEQVCPVAATVHDSEGLNTMVYNRCVGTRYCSNNCPFKVRRFNYFDWHARDPRLPGNDTPPFLNIPDQQQNTIDSLKRMIYNPEVTIRMRGVMEKCTYCTQRIAGAKSQAKIQFTAGRRPSDTLADGEVVTACQQACPTDAIVFGDLRDPSSRVSQLKKSPRNYAMLKELNLGNRTTCLAKVRNTAET